MRWTALLVLWACSVEQAFEAPDYGLERMLSQPRYDPYEPSTFFPDGRVMQVPPEGTVPASAPQAAEDVLRGEVSGAFVARLPVEPTAELLRRGRERYDIFCAPCHGVRGDGDSVVGRNMPHVPPRSLVSGELAAAPPGRIYRAIARGFGLMPDYETQLELQDRWAVVAYVQALRLSRGVPLSTLPPALQEEAQGALR